MGRAASVVQVGSKHSHRCPSERLAEGVSPAEKTETRRTQRQGDQLGRDGDISLYSKACRQPPEVVRG